MATVTVKGYPALYLDATQRKVLLRRSPAHALEAILHGAEYDLFRHLIELLQAGWQQTHWIWSYLIWPTAQPKFPKEAFATHCTKLRKKIETVWQLGPMLGRGDRRSGAIPIEVKDVHFFTDAAPEGTAFPIWALFCASEQAMRAYQAEAWEAAANSAKDVVTIDPENWLGNILLCQLALRMPSMITDPVVQRAIAFAHHQKDDYERALHKLDSLDKVDGPHKDRIRSRYEALQLIVSRVSLPSSTPPHAERRPPWRDREQLKAWINHLDGLQHPLPQHELRTLQEIQRFLRHHFHWASPQQVKEHFCAFLHDLACDSSAWPEEKLPRSKRAFKNRALDYVLANLCRLPDDEESKAITKAQNLRKLWSFSRNPLRSNSITPAGSATGGAARSWNASWSWNDLMSRPPGRMDERRIEDQPFGNISHEREGARTLTVEVRHEEDRACRCRIMVRRMARHGRHRPPRRSTASQTGQGHRRSPSRGARG
jgi:hypothetical protein